MCWIDIFKTYTRELAFYGSVKHSKFFFIMPDILLLQLNCLNGNWCLKEVSMLF
jgi:hypothetical protein